MTETVGLTLLYVVVMCRLSRLAISAVVVAIQMIQAHCKHLKYRKKIVLVTDARGSIDGDDISQISEKLKADSIELTIVLVLQVRRYWYLT